MTDVQHRNREILDAIQIRRDDFYDALIDLERVLAMPSAHDPAHWVASVRQSVGRLAPILEEHVRGTEGEGGVFADIRDHVPRLIHAVDRLQAQHDPLREAAAALAARLDAVTSEADVDQVRELAVELIRRMLTHRHRGAELVYDAYSVDVSGGD